MPVTIKKPETEKEFEDYYDLRWRVLREPWKQARDTEKDEIENNSFHLMACDENKNVLGVGRLHFNTESEAQIRYMAVDIKNLNQGVGSSMLIALEKQALAKQCTDIVLDARESALEFYEQKGYHNIKKSHLLYNTIQHYRMTKSL